MARDEPSTLLESRVADLVDEVVAALGAPVDVSYDRHDGVWTVGLEPRRAGQPRVTVLVAGDEVAGTVGVDEDWELPPAHDDDPPAELRRLLTTALRGRLPSDRSRRALWKGQDADLTYPAVGASLAALPAGYHHVRRRRVLGAGADPFTMAVERLMTWQVHRSAGLTVTSSHDRVELGAVVVLGVGLGPVRVLAPCRVVRVLDEPGRQGFAYGTLPGHPESGEELFVVTRDEADRVSFDITAFSRPATWWARAGAPVGRRVQHHVTERYLAGIQPPS